MKSNTWLLFLSIILLSLSCVKEEPEIPVIVEEAIDREKFVGDYELELVHISGIHTFYDSIGYIIYQGFDTNTVSNEMISINLGGGNDSLLITELINSFSNFRTEVKAVVENDTIKIDHDFSDQTSNNYIKGDLWLEGDSIFLSYIWDHSDTWSTGALPVRGTIEGRGILIE